MQTTMSQRNQPRLRVRCVYLGASFHKCLNRAQFPVVGGQPQWRQAPTTRSRLEVRGPVLQQCIHDSQAPLGRCHTQWCDLGFVLQASAAHDKPLAPPTPSAGCFSTRMPTAKATRPTCAQDEELRHTTSDCECDLPTAANNHARRRPPPAADPRLVHSLFVLHRKVHSILGRPSA